MLVDMTKPEYVTVDLPKLSPLAQNALALYERTTALREVSQDHSAFVYHVLRSEGLPERIIRSEISKAYEQGLIKNQSRRARIHSMHSDLTIAQILTEG